MCQLCSGCLWQPDVLPCLMLQWLHSWFAHHVSNFRVGEVRLTLQVSILFCFICQTFKLLQNFILGGSKWRQSGSHMQEQSKNLVPARSKLLEHSVWIKLTMWKPESMKCKSGCGLGTTMQAKECVTESHSSDPHSLLQLKRKRICKLGVSTIMYLLRTSSKELEELYHQPCWKSM